MGEPPSVLEGLVRSGVGLKKVSELLRLRSPENLLDMHKQLNEGLGVQPKRTRGQILSQCGHTARALARNAASDRRSGSRASLCARPIALIIGPARQR
jgi:hypothetical protein